MHSRRLELDEHWSIKSDDLTGHILFILELLLYIHINRKLVSSTKAVNVMVQKTKGAE